MERRAWTRDELVKVMALYCQIPFGKMHARNPAVIALAETMNRTPSAVALKLVNFASLDPELRERGIGGMPNISPADRHVWKEFYGRWDELADASIVDVVDTVDPVRRETRLELSMPTGPTEVSQETKVRRGQAFFRGAVMAAHNWKCCVTGITAPELLRASHIVPWSQNAALRLDPRNGLCLNALHDAAFDRGLITFSATFEMRLSSRLKEEVPSTVYEEMFKSRSGTPIVMPERFTPTSEIMQFHRNSVFCG